MFPSHTTHMWCYILYILQPLLLGMYRWFLISKTEVWRHCTVIQVLNVTLVGTLSNLFVHNDSKSTTCHTTYSLHLIKAAVKQHYLIFYSMMLGRTVVQSAFIHILMMMSVGRQNTSAESRWVASDSTFSLTKILLRNKHYSSSTANSHPKRNHTYMTSKVQVFLALGQTQINNMTNTINSCHMMRLKQYSMLGHSNCSYSLILQTNLQLKCLYIPQP
jgi:hypothetical protein